ncbi:MAG: ABC transporter permease subunit [Euryarchaeota archaeon]|nr:ABC transporter permease subunit [Euryarchaeota archaeon]
MTIYTQEYRKWEGRYKKRPFKILGMILFGVKRAWSSKWTKICLIVGWIPVLFYIVFSLISSSFMMETFENMRNSFFSNYFSLQELWLIFLTAVVGSSLISEDIKNKSITLYYSSPIEKIDYFLGKFGIIGTFIASITLIPSTVLYWTLTLISTGEIKSGLWLWGGCMLYSLILIVFFSMLILSLSSLTGNGKYAGASLFGLILGSGVVGGIIYEITDNPRALLFSLSNNLSVVRDKIFRNMEQHQNILGDTLKWYHSLAVLAGVTILLWSITYIKLSKMELSE